jgi:predicted phage-related endonuclease
MFVLHQSIDAAHARPTRPQPTTSSLIGAATQAIDAGRHALAWPRLDQLVLGRAEQERRREFIGGSDANIILGGSDEALLRLWREKRGEGECEDLSSKLAVVLGCWTEALNRQWYEKVTCQRVERAGEVVRCPVHAWRGCTLDGFVEGAGAVWEAKHTSGFTSAEDILSRYMPQLQHNMAVAGAERAILSVIFGNAKWELFEVASDWLYQEELLEAEAGFWRCVDDGSPPVATAPPPAPRPVGVREICLQGSNAWAAAAADWLQHREAAKKHATAVSCLKELVEANVARAFGHGVEAKRSKAGAITIRELVA